MNAARSRQDEVNRGEDMSGSGLRVLSAGAVKRGVAKIAEAFERETGTPVTVEFTPVPEVKRRIAGGERADVLVATPAVVDELAQAGRIATESRGAVGRSRMGIVVHAQGATPDLSDAAAFRRALEAATHVVHNQASSGLYAARLIERLGLAQTLAEKLIVVPEGAAVMETVAARGPGVLGLAQISEVMVLIEKGCPVKLAAPLPDEIQNVTSYDAAAAAGASAAAHALARALTSESARKVFADTGIS
jgi:molybdate transport system substrate-binding protein